MKDLNNKVVELINKEITKYQQYTTSIPSRFDYPSTALRAGLNESTRNCNRRCLNVKH